jgi:hypothetical protein
VVYDKACGVPEAVGPKPVAFAVAGHDEQVGTGVGRYGDDLSLWVPVPHYDFYFPPEVPGGSADHLRRREVRRFFVEVVRAMAARAPAEKATGCRLGQLVHARRGHVQQGHVSPRRQELLR